MENALKRRYLELIMFEARYAMCLNEIILFKIDDPGDVRWLSSCIPKNPRNSIIIRFLLGTIAFGMFICYIPMNLVDTSLALFLGVFSLLVGCWLFVTHPEQVRRECDYKSKIKGFNNILKLSNDYLEEILKLRGIG